MTTDCLEMRAIADHYGPGETAVLAALAGIDSILFSHTRAAQEAAYDALLSAARDGRLPLSIVDAANRRLAAFKAAFLRPPGSLADIGTPEHAAIAEEAARAGVTVVRRGSALPLGGVVGVVEFASVLESGIVERGGQAGFARALKARLPHAEVLTMMSAGDPAAALALAERVDTLVLAVRNAHLIPEQLAAARQIMQAARQVALVCLRNPYDASALDDADSALCTCGDSTPSLAAAVAALMGDYEPDGVLPVQVALA